MLMSELQQAARTLPRSHSLGFVRRLLGMRSTGRSFVVVTTAWLGLVTLLTACADDPARRENSELRVDSPAAEPIEDSATGPAAGPLPAPAMQTSAYYRVVVETAYFFDAPEQGVPSGKYLRRGDVFYGEGEANDFVKTGFRNPDGTAGTGWLKAQDLSKHVAGRAPGPAPRRAPRPAARPTLPSAPDDYATADTSSAPPERPRSASRGGTLVVVRVARSYFYDSSDLLLPRKAHCVRGDKVRLGEQRGEAVFVTFTNWEQITTTGWMRQDALYNR